MIKSNSVKKRDGFILMFYVYYACFLQLSLKLQYPEVLCKSMVYGARMLVSEGWLFVCENYMFSVLGCLLYSYYMV